MKHKGSKCELAEERDAELLRAYTKLIGERDKISITEVCKTLAETPCSRFYISEERANIVIGDLLKGRSLANMIPLRREMFLELFRRYKIYKLENPSLTRMEVICRVCRQPAPKFYLTPSSIVVILNRVRKEAKRKCYEQRKRRLRFMSGTL